MEVKNNINFNVDDLAVNLDKELYSIANKIVIPLLKELILKQEQVDGSRFPDLEKSTIELKKKKGKTKTLVDSGLLLDSFMAYRKGKGEVVVRIKSGRRDVGQALQVDGVGRKRKKFFFFGITDGMEKDCLDKMNELVKKAVK
jgi:hypothetical protein